MSFIPDLKDHFVRIHEIKFKRGNSIGHFDCAEKSCNSKIFSYKSFCANLKKHHLQSHTRSNDVIINAEVVDNESENLDQTEIDSSETCITDLKEKLKRNCSNLICSMRTNINTSEATFNRMLKYFDLVINEISQFHNTVNSNDINLNDLVT